MDHSVEILAIEDVTHNVRRYRFEKPAGYSFKPGQATDVSLDEEGWRGKKHPFTFTALTDDQQLEFTIKSYFNTGGDGVTEHLYGYTPGRRLIIRDVWGTITYRGPGVFIAGGAGVTPFIAILRDLHHRRKLAGHALVVSNRTGAGGALGVAYVARSTPDGHTLLFVPALAYSVLPLMQSNVGYTDKSFAPICQTFENQMALIVKPDSPFKTARDIAEAARARPDGRAAARRASGRCTIHRAQPRAGRPGVDAARSGD